MLDLDHARAEVGERERAERPGEDAGQVEHRDAGERSGDHLPLAAGRGAATGRRRSGHRRGRIDERALLEREVRLPRHARATRSVLRSVRLEVELDGRPRDRATVDRADALAADLPRERRTVALRCRRQHGRVLRPVVAAADALDRIDDDDVGVTVAVHVAFAALPRVFRCGTVEALRMRRDPRVGEALPRHRRLRADRADTAHETRQQRHRHHHRVRSHGCASDTTPDRSSTRARA